MKLETDQKGITVEFTWKEAEYLLKDFKLASYPNDIISTPTKALHNELDQILTEEGT